MSEKGFDIRRYHPSSQEQSILIPNLRLYFSYPERSPDRSRIASEVSNQLLKHSDHWSIRSVRLWFNNNKRIINSDSREIIDSGTEPEPKNIKKSSRCFY